MTSLYKFLSPSFFSFSSLLKAMLFQLYYSYTVFVAIPILGLGSKLIIVHPQRISLHRNRLIQLQQTKKYDKETGR